MFGFRLWSKSFLPHLQKRAQRSVQRDHAPEFIATDLLDFLQTQKIVRPGYTTLQDIVSEALTEERHRLKSYLSKNLTQEHKDSLKSLLANERTLCELAALKQDAKSFKRSMLRLEIKKHDILKPLHGIAQWILPKLGISQQNITHYASLIHHYNTYELARFEVHQTYLYLLCYVFKRYQQVNDNLIEALDLNVRKLEKITQTKAKEAFALEKDNHDKKIGQLLLLFVDDAVKEVIHQKAFAILPPETIRTLGTQMLTKSKNRQSIQWALREQAFVRYRQDIRPLMMKIDFASTLPDSPLLQVIEWMKSVFEKKQTLQQQLEAFPEGFISKRMRAHMLDNKQSNQLSAQRFEILAYMQMSKQLATGALFVKDSLRHRPFAHDLLSLKEKKTVLKSLQIPWLQTPCKKQINLLCKELETLWVQFNRRLKQNQIKHIHYDVLKKDIVWIKPKKQSQEPMPKQSFYDQLPLTGIADILRFVHEKTYFLSAFQPLQPRYIKKERDIEDLIAVIIAQGLGIGHYRMDQTSDASYAVLESTYQQYLRLPSLRQAHDKIANAATSLRMFPYYTIDDLQALFGALDGQKFEAMTPTAKARYSRKYFKKGKGVVAYTLLSQHIPIQSELIGAHEHESYFVFDHWYKNTSLLQPTILTGDMHSMNKANFALLHWFGAELRPRLKNLKLELKRVFGSQNPSAYKKFLVHPAGQIDKQLLLDETDNIDHIVATLGLKEVSQSTLIKKLCSLPAGHKTRKAVFEWNKLLESIYILKALLDPQILIDVHRSQNRLESYHMLRAAIAKSGGKKGLLGRTNLEMEISNQCGRLLAGAIIFYNMYIHSELLSKKLDKRQLKALKKPSPVAWEHIHFTGHFTFYDDKTKIDIDAIIQNIEL